MPFITTSTLLYGPYWSLLLKENLERQNDAGGNFAEGLKMVMSSQIFNFYH